MNIALVFDKMLWGGIERVGISYVKMFIEEGNHVDVYVLNPHTEEIINELKEICNVKVINFKPGNCPENSWHIALCHDMHGIELICFSIAYMGLLLKNKFTKNLYKTKDKKYDLAIAFSGHINDLTYVAKEYINAKKKIAWLHGAQYQYNMISPGFYRLYKNIKNLVCLSDLCDTECEKFNLKNDIRKKKIYNPCIVKSNEMDESKIKQLKKMYGDFCLMVGRLAKDKDQETVIKSIKILKDKFGIHKKLILVGDGEKRKSLEVLVNKLKLKEYIYFEGAKEDVQNYYSAAQIYVHAAPLEGFPTVFMEAMFFGTPIVTTDAIPGAREILGNNEFGLVSTVGNSYELAENIKKLHFDKKLMSEYIKKGKERVRDFHPDKIKKEVLNYFDELMEEEK